MKKINDAFNSMTSVTAISISFDTKMCEGLQKVYDKEFIAFKNEEYGMGVFVSEDMDFGVYGDNIRVISKYCDMHEDEIKEVLIAADSMDMLCESMSRILADCLIDFLKTSNAA